MSEPNLDELLAGNTPANKARDLPLEVARKRNAELSKRNAAARYMAIKALTVLHRDDYQSLMSQARAKVDSDRGPLPGDPS